MLFYDSRSQDVHGRLSVVDEYTEILVELRLELYHDNSVCLEGSEAAEMIWIHEDVSQGFKKEVDDFGVITRAKDRQRPAL